MHAARRTLADAGAADESRQDGLEGGQRRGPCPARDRPEGAPGDRASRLPAQRQREPAPPGLLGQHRPGRRGPRQPVLLPARRCRGARGPKGGTPAISASAEGDPEREATWSRRWWPDRSTGWWWSRQGSATPVTGRGGAPVVYVDRPGVDLSTDTVLSDNAGGVRSAVEHLAARGHRRIGFLGDDVAVLDRPGARACLPRHPRRPPTRWPAARRDGPAHAELARRRARDVDRSARPGDRPGDGQQPGDRRHVARPACPAQRLARRETSSAPTCAADGRGRAQDPGAMGRAAALQLFARIKGEDGPPRSVTVPTHLIVRESSSLMSHGERMSPDRGGDRAAAGPQHASAVLPWRRADPWVPGAQRARRLRRPTSRGLAGVHHTALRRGRGRAHRAA